MCAAWPQTRVVALHNSCRCCCCSRWRPCLGQSHTLAFATLVRCSCVLQSTRFTARLRPGLCATDTSCTLCKQATCSHGPVQQLPGSGAGIVSRPLEWKQTCRCCRPRSAAQSPTWVGAWTPSARAWLRLSPGSAAATGGPHAVPIGRRVRTACPRLVPGSAWRV